MSMQQQSAPATSAGHVSRLVYPPIVHVIWGIILLIAFILGSMLQVQTNEAWMLHAENPNMWIPNFNLFNQFPEFWNGQMDARHTVAFLFAWGVQIVMITCKIGLARVQVQVMKKYGGNLSSAEVLKSAKRRGAFWDFLSGLIVLGNSITDFLYAAGMGFLQQLAFTVVVFLTSFYAGTHGIQHIAAGVSDMSKN